MAAAKKVAAAAAPVTTHVSQSFQAVAEAVGSGVSYPLNLNFGNTVYDLLNAFISGSRGAASTATGSAIASVGTGTAVVASAPLTIIITTSLLITYQLFRCLNAQYEQYAAEVYLVQKYMTILTRISNYLQVISKTSELYNFEFPTGDINDQLLELTAMCANLFTESEKIGLLERRLNADYNPVFVQGADGEAPKYTMLDIAPESVPNGASRFSRAQHAVANAARASAVHAGNAVAGTARSITKFGYRVRDILTNLRVVVFPKNEWLAIFNEKLIELNSNYAITVSEYQTILNVQQQLSDPETNKNRARVIQQTQAYQCMFISILFGSLLKLRRQFSACAMSSNSVGCKELMDPGLAGTTRQTKMQRLKAYLLRIREPQDISVFETAISGALHKTNASLTAIINNDAGNETHPLFMVEFANKFNVMFTLAYQKIRDDPSVAGKAFKYYALMEYAHDLLTACAHSTRGSHISCAKEIEYAFDPADASEVLTLMTTLGSRTPLGPPSPPTPLETPETPPPQQQQPPPQQQQQQQQPRPPALIRADTLVSKINSLYIIFCNIQNAPWFNVNQLHDEFFKIWDEVVELFYEHSAVLKANLTTEMLSFLSGLKLVQAASLSDATVVRTVSTLARIFKTIDFGQPCSVIKVPVSESVKLGFNLGIGALSSFGIKVKGAMKAEEPLLQEVNEHGEDARHPQQHAKHNVALSNFVPYTLDWHDNVGSCDACSSFQCITGGVSDPRINSCIRFLSIVHSATVSAIFADPAPAAGFASKARKFIQTHIGAEVMPVSGFAEFTAKYKESKPEYNKFMFSIMNMHSIYGKKSALDTTEQFEMLVGLNFSHRSMNNNHPDPVLVVNHRPAAAGPRSKKANSKDANPKKGSSSKGDGAARGGIGGTRKRPAKYGRKRTHRHRSASHRSASHRSASHRSARARSNAQ
jgi:hypothetical protein